ncbi:hypothetical protein HK104_002348 [Borealophlyctis nickersoniae]|nr:hypothetical protein HK104_002348 [Borealophlyctis nickersoniae]
MLRPDPAPSLHTSQTAGLSTLSLADSTTSMAVVPYEPSPWPTPAGSSTSIAGWGDAGFADMDFPTWRTRDSPEWPAGLKPGSIPEFSLMMQALFHLRSACDLILRARLRHPLPDTWYLPADYWKGEIPWGSSWNDMNQSEALLEIKKLFALLMLTKRSYVSAQHLHKTLFPPSEAHIPRNAFAEYENLLQKLYAQMGDDARKEFDKMMYFVLSDVRIDGSGAPVGQRRDQKVMGLTVEPGDHKDIYGW